MRSNSHDDLVEAGVKAVAKFGVDKVTVANVITITGHSRPTFYSYFGDISGMLADIWIKHGVAWLDAVLAEVSSKSGKSAKRTQALDSAMQQIVSVAHRVPELLEVLKPDMQAWWNENTSKSEISKLRIAWLMGIKLGVDVSKVVTPEIVAAEAFLPVIDSATDEIERDSRISDLPAPPVYPEASPVLANPGNTEENIMRATIEVIANSGIEAASVARVARRCRVSTGTIYPRFPTGRTLVEASFAEAINDIVASNLSQASTIGFGFDQYALTVRAGFGENRRIWRDYRLEMHVAAMHDESLARIMQPGFEQSRQMLVNSAMTMPGMKAEVVDYVTHMMQACAIGFSILFNAGVPLDKLDHRKMVRFYGIQMLGL